jgi:hypothetical protein
MCVSLCVIHMYTYIVCVHVCVCARVYDQAHNTRMSVVRARVCLSFRDTRWNSKEGWQNVSRYGIQQHIIRQPAVRRKVQSQNESLLE